MPGSEWNWRKLLLLAAGAAGAVAIGSPAAIELSVTRSGASALLRIGSASASFVFVSGQECPEADRCTVPMVPLSVLGALDGPSGTAVAKS